jgi:site-specific DNA-methyltransferase (adenine-specific)
MHYLFANKVIQGDCITVMRSLPNASVDLVLTDPPYLVNYIARDGRRCANDHDGRWLAPAFRELHRVLKPDRLCVSFYGWPWIERFMAAWKQCGFRPVSHLVWTKTHCSRQGYTQSHHEAAYLLAKGRPPKPAHPPKDVLPWEYTQNIHHPNEKPVSGLVPLIDAFSQPGDIVLDPFAGSGSTGLAACARQRRFILIELSGQHCATAQARLNALAENKVPSALPARVI